MLHEIVIDCPYCGEPLDTLVDASAGGQDYVEDCQVCCSPIEFRITVDTSGELASVDVRRDDE